MYGHVGRREELGTGSVERMFLPMSSSAGDLRHHGSGVARNVSKVRKGSSAFFSSFLTVCTALSACPLLAEVGAAGDVLKVVLFCELREFL